MRIGNGKRHISSFQIIILGFLSVILMGTILLMLPAATRQGEGASFGDALFTSTSAVCVTGLVIHDTANYWSIFGQAVIMLLIQTGGMGVVTVAVSIAIVSGRKIGLMQRSTMQESISAPHVGGIVRMTGFILKVTIAAEIIGAALLATVFCKELGFLKGIWYAIFHAVSAFCNAGFDLMGNKGEFSSLTAYADSPMINIVIMCLIVLGGIGFLTWDDINANKFNFRRYHMQSKVILAATAILIILPTTYMYFFEFRNIPSGERLWISLFQSVTPRTAGFNTIDISELSESGSVLLIVLMLIGGSPGSTAGGMKTTTAAVLFFSALSVFRKKDNTHIFGRRVPHRAERNASTVAMMYIVMALLSGMVISRIESIPVVSAMFETASAIGTVGLSMGITPGLGMVSRIILIVLMFFGRAGGLTLIFAALPESNCDSYRFPQENITVG